MFYKVLFMLQFGKKYKRGKSNKNMKKRGWVRIVEAFVAILLIAGVLLIVINKGALSGDNSEEIYKKEIAVLRGIQTDDVLRNEIISIDKSSLPIVWENVPNGIKERITTSMGDSLDCVAKICLLDEICVLEEYSQEDIYSRAVAITANITDYSLKQLKLFCSIKK